MIPKQIQFFQKFNAQQLTRKIAFLSHTIIQTFARGTMCSGNLSAYVPNWIVGIDENMDSPSGTPVMMFNPKTVTIFSDPSARNLLRFEFQAPR